MADQKARGELTKNEREWVSDIRFVNATMAEMIIKDRIPGLYILRSQGKYIGIDTHTGEVRTQEFYGKIKCIDWLLDSVRNKRVKKNEWISKQ